MSIMQSMPRWQPEAAFDAFDWGCLSPASVVVDVGGGDGSFAVALSNGFPALKSIAVQVVPAVIEQAKGKIPESLRGIFTPQAADFSEPQPVKGADIYFLRKILHDWPDEHAIRILQQLVLAMKPGTRILINDHWVPPPGTLSPIQERRLR
jgi:6-hydroxytryprostatin B O-methyltransferase